MNSAEIHLQPGQAQLQKLEVEVIMAVRRGWWLFVLAVILASALSVAEYVRRTPRYQSGQPYVILVSPAGALTTYDLYQARVWEETIGHALTEGRLTTVAGGFTPLINAQLARDPADDVPHHLSPSQLRHNLAWSNSGNSIQLTAYWTTPEGASALVRATAAALQSGDLTHVTILRGGLPPQMVARIIPTAPATSAVVDQSQQAAAQQLLLAHLALGLVAGLLLLLIWEWVHRLVRRRTHSLLSSSSSPAAGDGSQDVHPETSTREQVRASGQ
jgi:hypothetical protein